MKITTLCDQSLFDISIIQTGGIASVFQIASQNNISVTDDLLPGQSIEVKKSKSNSVTGYYKTKGITCATGNLKKSGLELRVFTKEFTKEFC